MRWRRMFGKLVGHKPPPLRRVPDGSIEGWSAGVFDRRERHFPAATAAGLLFAVSPDFPRGQVQKLSYIPPR